MVVGDSTFGMTERGEPRATDNLRNLPSVRWIKAADRASYARVFEELLEGARAPRPVRTSADDGAVECRAVVKDGALSVYLINLGDRETTVTLRWEGGKAPRHLRNLLTGLPISPGPVKLERCGLLLLAGSF